MIGRCVAAAFGAVAVAMAAGCGGSTSGMATAPDDVTPYTSTTSTSEGPKRTSVTTAPTTDAPAGVSAEAVAAVRSAGIAGSDSAIADQLSLACIMGDGSFNDTRQDVVDVLVQMGSELPPDALRTIVDVAIEYECPELADKLR